MIPRLTPESSRALSLRARGAAAKHWQVKPDNREPDTRRLALGGTGCCWCGEPHGHQWPGQGDGAPHPRQSPGGES